MHLFSIDQSRNLDLEYLMEPVIEIDYRASLLSMLTIVEHVSFVHSWSLLAVIEGRLASDGAILMVGEGVRRKVGLGIVGLAIVGLAIVGLAIVGLAIVRLAIVGLTRRSLF
jgi:hypothetical protein